MAPKRPLATSSLAGGRFAAKQGSLRSPNLECILVLFLSKSSMMQLPQRLPMLLHADILTMIDFQRSATKD